jgi:hypothetical protein
MTAICGSVEEVLHQVLNHACWPLNRGKNWYKKNIIWDRSLGGRGRSIEVTV